MAAATQPQQQQQQRQPQPQQQHNRLPHGLGLLTTVASLPPKYRSRYLNIKTKCEIPLDLSVKTPPTVLTSPQIANDVPMASTFTEVYTEPYSEAPLATTQNGKGTPREDLRNPPTPVLPPNCTNVTLIRIQKENKPLTPPATPTKRKYSEHVVGEDYEEHSTVVPSAAVQQSIENTYTNPPKLSKTLLQPNTKRECTPTKPIKPADSAPKTTKPQPPPTGSKSSRNKATRKLKFDEETSSPVSGTIIRPLEDITGGTVQYSNGDIDPKYNIVEITEETKAELAAIKNVIGDYICRLCRIKFEDAFGLAQHRCACIVLLEYRCPECGKQFNCPANLASHRRWHKPKKDTLANGAIAKKENRLSAKQLALSTPTAQAAESIEELPYPCQECGKRFKRQAYLRKHQLVHVNAHKKKATARPPVAVIQSATTTLPVSEPSVQAAGYNNDGLSSHPSYAGSSASSLHSYNGTHEDDVVYAVANNYDYDAADCLSDTSSCSSSPGYGRLQIVETAGLTEEENIAAAALTNLRNCASVIQHTTLAH